MFVNAPYRDCNERDVNQVANGSPPGQVVGNASVLLARFHSTARFGVARFNSEIPQTPIFIATAYCKLYHNTERDGRKQVMDKVKREIKTFRD